MKCRDHTHTPLTFVCAPKPFQHFSHSSVRSGQHFSGWSRRRLLKRNWCHDKDIENRATNSPNIEMKQSNQIGKKQ
jgi:hypothetical protein